MGKVVEFTEIKERIVAVEASIRATKEEKKKRSERLISLLGSIEKNVSLRNQEIKRLREEQARAAEEIRELTSMLQNMLTLAEHVQALGPFVPIGDADDVIDRLTAMLSSANVAQGREKSKRRKHIFVRRRIGKRSRGKTRNRISEG